MAVKVVNEYLDAVYNLYNLVEDKILCNKVKDRGSIESRISLPTKDIISAYLILAFTRSTNVDVVKWKISFNDVILTRELKPHIEKPIDSNYMQSLFVYDVSKIMIRDEASIRISCTAKGFVGLDGATLLTIMRYKGFHTYIDCEVDPYIINDNVVKQFNLVPSFKANEISLHIGVVAPATSMLEIKTSNETVKKFKLLGGYNVIEANLNNSLPGLIQMQGGSGIRHIFSCIALRYSHYPRIAIENIYTRESVVRMRLKNTGQGSCDSLDILILRYGVPLKRIPLGSLKPDEYLDIELNVGDLLGQDLSKLNGLSIRILWTKAHKLFEYDVPIKF